MESPWHCPLRFLLLLVWLGVSTGAPMPRANAQPPASPEKPATPARPPDIEPEPDRWRLLEPQGIGVKPRNPLYDPYNPNVLKGDYPLIGDKILLAATATLDSIVDFRRNLDFFQTGRIRNIPFHEHNTVGQVSGILALEVFQGDTVFAPKDWAIRATPIFRWRCGDKNAIDQGCGEDARLLETFGEAKLFEIGRTFDATSARLGLQFFTSDFFGFIYNDVQPGGRVFSEIARNQFKVNVAAFDRLNKEKLSGLNEFKRREHQVVALSVQGDDFARIPLAGVAHQVGTTRFGTDPRTSVLDINCKAHDLDNLYVVDGGFFCSSAAVNPALTIMANALRVADHLAARLK